MKKSFPVKEVVLVVIALGFGLVIGRKWSDKSSAVVPVREAVSLPTVEVTVDGKSLGNFLYAKGTRDRTDAWLQWVTASGRGDRAQRVVMEMEEPCRFPMMDVPPDMAVVWVKADGAVLGSTVSPGSRTNLLIPPQVALRALMVEKELAPAAGGQVSVLVKVAK